MHLMTRFSEYKKLPDRISKYYLLPALLSAALLCTAMFTVCFLIPRLNSASNKDWTDGLAFWQKSDAASAYKCWSRRPAATWLAAQRPAKFLYWRMRALRETGRNDMAEAERARLLKLFPYDYYSFLASPAGGIDTGSNAVISTASEISYRRPWKAEVSKASLKTGVPEYIIWAVMRRESKFNARAVSRTGAYGLMQVMPKTAAYSARRLGVKNINIGDPEQNVTIGAYHVSGLLWKFGGSITRAAAAYNAGAAPVIRWGTLGARDWAEWVECIPYPQTREFVRSVLENREVYRILCGNEKAMSLYEISNAAVRINTARHQPQTD